MIFETNIELAEAKMEISFIFFDLPMIGSMVSGEVYIN